MKNIILLYISLAVTLTIEAQNPSRLCEAIKAYQSSKIETAYTIFSEIDSIEPIIYHHDLWKYYVSSEILNDSAKAKTLLFRLIQSNGFERNSLNQQFFEDKGLRKRGYWSQLDSLIQISESRKCQPFIDSLAIMAKNDQTIRQMLYEQGWTDEIVKQMEDVDSINIVKLQELITRYGFPSWKLVGQKERKTHG